MVYAVQDWMRGLTGEGDTHKLWTKFKKTDAGKRLSTTMRQLPYVAKNGKTYKLNHVDDKGLYLIAQHMRVAYDCPILDEIRSCLANAGAFVDEVRREPDKLAESFKDPEKLLDAFIEYHRKRGKDDSIKRLRRKFALGLNT